MDTAVWICIFVPIFMVLMMQSIGRKKQKQQNIIKALKMKGGFEMSEAVKRFIGKDCIITTMNENVTGVIEAVEDDWIVVKSKSNNAEIIKIDYISRVQEYPRNKNGKKKVIVS